MTRIFIFTCVVLISASISFAQEKGSPVNVRYDKKTDTTTVRLKPFKISRLILEKEASTDVPLHQVDLEIYFTYRGQTSSSPVEDVFFRFQVSSSNYVFLRPQESMAILDNTAGNGRAFSLGVSDYKSYPPKFNSVFEETLVVKAPSDALTKMAKAEKLQIYLGPVAYDITDKQFAAIRALADSLPSQPREKE